MENGECSVFQCIAVSSADRPCSFWFLKVVQWTVRSCDRGPNGAWQGPWSGTRKRPRARRAMIGLHVMFCELLITVGRRQCSFLYLSYDGDSQCLEQIFCQNVIAHCGFLCEDLTCCDLMGSAK